MKISKKVLSLLLVISMVFSIIPNSLAYAAEKSSNENTYQGPVSDSNSHFDGGIIDSGIQVTGIKLNKTSLTLENGKSETLTATLSPNDASDQEIFWATSNSTVCAVDQNGTVTAVGNGPAIITAMTHGGGFTAKCKVNVITSITGITINKTKTTIAKGSKETLIARVTPAGTSNQDINWSSSDENICTVDSSGNVSALNVGTAIVSVTTKDSGYTAACLVTVIAPVTGVTLNKTELILESGKFETLTATVAPVGATNKGVFWSSSDSAVCTVGQDGKVTAVGNGSTTITVTTNDGNFTAKCSVNVNTRVTGITLNKTSMTLSKGSKETLIASVLPADASQQEVSWFSSDGTVCTVNSSGEVSALSMGTAVIFATTKDGGYTKACIVTVVIPANGITLNKTELTLENGKSETLTATVTPSDATDQGISWSSSNNLVCTVDQNGKITTVGNGSATITVTTYDGAFTAKCNVNVRTSVKGITLNKAKITLTQGSKETLIATVTPTGASQRDVLWFSSDGTVCTVDSSGNVSSLIGGTAVVYATTKDGGYIASCIVTVTTPVTGVTLNKTELTLENGKTEILAATVNPSDATDQKISWSSSNNSVCTVGEDGNVTAVGNGTAVISVTTYDGSFAAKCNVNVITSVTGVTLNNTKITLTKGSKETLIATVSPVGASQQDVLWSSSDENVCTVDSSGNITASNVGMAEISATTKDGKYTAKCSITVVIPVSGVDLNKTELTLEKGNSDSLSATVTPAGATNQKIFWASSNNAVCAVDQSGKVTAISNGTAVITVMTLDGGITAECNVTVITSVTGVTLNKTNSTLVKGSKETLTATVTPESASQKDVLWSSSDGNVCAVDSSGNITALNAGTAIITATTKDGGFTAKCTITVVIPVTGVVLNKTELTLEKGKADSLSATVTPADATNQKIFWASSNNAVCAVDQSGKVTAISNGTAVITVMTLDGGITAECNVTIITSVTGVMLNKTNTTLVKGAKETLTATVSPDDATDKSVEWTSSDETIATVDATGKVTAVNTGMSIITVKSHDGGFTAECIVTVVIPVTGITLDKMEFTLVKGTNQSLIPTISPEDATDKAIVWSSSDTNIATVDENGKITAVADGTATIKVTTHDGKFTAECKVTVIIPVTGISLNKATTTILPGQSEILIATIQPYDATNKEVTWSSSNSGVATVDSSGKVTAIGAGTATIKVTAHDGGFTAQCTVTVMIPVTGISLNKTSLPLIKGTSETLSANITPSDATNKAITWKSSDSTVATVDSTGKVTAIQFGTATITVTAADGNFTTTCTVTVKGDCKGTIWNMKPGRSIVHEDGSFFLINENVWTYGETFNASLTLTFDTAISYSPATPIISLTNAQMFKYGAKNPAINIYADDVVVSSISGVTEGRKDFYTTSSGSTTQIKIQLYAYLPNLSSDNARVYLSSAVGELLVNGQPIRCIEVIS